MDLNLKAKIVFPLILFSALFYSGPLSASPSNGSSLDVDLTSLEDSRIFAICVPTHNTKADKLYSTIDWDGFGERDLVIIEVQNNAANIVTSDDKLKLTLRSRATNNFSDRSIMPIIQCGERLEFVLIGKDKTVKQRWNNFPSFGTLYALIDAMPIRRFEMRQQKEKN